MENLVRTTITLPKDLYEQLRTAAFTQRTTISRLVRRGISKVVGRRKPVPKGGVKSLMGKYAIAGEAGMFDRRKFYEKIIQKKMSS
ncbi:MAG: hypothetical protein ACPLRN_04165 [Microgenomates group bacterium]